MDYKKSGVDIDLADKFVDKIKNLVSETYDERTVSGVGGFAALYRMEDDRYLASSTDGVGTKLKLAIELNKHDTIGQDLVGMCVNDLICAGARPLFFLDYFATGKLDLGVGEAVVGGIARACKAAGVALIGGETAEMPGMYVAGDYDLAGFSVGELTHAQLLGGTKVKTGDTLIGIASSGFHSNGYSLIRRVLESVPDENRRELSELCLVPTKLYVKTFLQLRQTLGEHLHGLAHITGSGFLNIPRLNEAKDYHITQLPPASEIAAVIPKLCEYMSLSQMELLKTFNMGVGLVMATDRPQLAMEVLSKQQEKAWVLGNVTEGNGKIFISGQEL